MVKLEKKKKFEEGLCCSQSWGCVVESFESYSIPSG